MANPEHVEWVRRGVLNVERENYADLVLDFIDSDLSNIVMVGMNFSGANFSGAKLSGAKLTSANFLNADLSGAILRSADLTVAVFGGATLAGADLSGADCTSADFVKADLTGVIATKNTILKNACLVHARFDFNLLRQADIAGVQLRQANLTGIDLSGRNLSGAMFEDAILNEAKLINIIATEVHFGRAQLKKANLQNSDISRSYFGGANLSGADLSGANCNQAKFKSAILDRAEINGADFAEALLDNASWRHIKGAHLARNLVTSNLREGVRYFETVIWDWPERWLDWETIRIAGRLPVFGPSYTGVILIPAYLYFLQIYNDKVEAARAWINKTASNADLPSASSANAILDHLHTEPIPDSFFWLFLSTFFLAVASTIYALGCPSRVKEFSRDQWCDELGRSLVHYWPEAWKWRTARLACAAFYTIGGTGVIFALAPKLWRTAVVLWRSEFMF